MNRYLHETLRRTQILPICTAGLGSLAILLSLACASGTQSAGVSPAPLVGRWPEPAFLPEHQCRGRYTVDALERYVSRARLAMWLPSTRSVVLDRERRCITVTVNSVGAARLAELIMRGVAVPRRAVLLLLAGTEPRPRAPA
jgi:hypothetical protein